MLTDGSTMPLREVTGEAASIVDAALGRLLASDCTVRNLAHDAGHGACKVVSSDASGVKAVLEIENGVVLNAVIEDSRLDEVTMSMTETSSMITGVRKPAGPLWGRLAKI